MGYKAAAQVLKSAEAVKCKLMRKCDLLNDVEAWTDQQQLQTIYHQVLVLDLEYALDKKVEQELWTLGFKNHISVLQELVRDKKNPKRSDTQALLSWCLESASGFYLTLLQELCTTFNLDLPFRKKGTTYGQLKCTNVAEQIIVPQPSSCLYICQYCLVHLGDIARYRNQKKQAENFYKQAIVVSPTSGHPYNQLALLEASNRDKLSTVFHYTRGIAVKNPFPATATNLSNTFSAIIDKEEPLLKIQTKMTVCEFINLFLRVHALLHNLTNLQQAEALIKRLNSTFTALIATQSFTENQLVKMTVINLYSLWHLNSNNSCSDVAELTADEKSARELILELIVGSLSAFLLPVYTLKADKTILNYYALSAIKLVLYWIQINQEKILEEEVFTRRLEIWPGLCKLLNNIQENLQNEQISTNSKYDKSPLKEDVELQGFLPLCSKFNEFDFKSTISEEINDKENVLRCQRIVEIGKWLTTISVKNVQLIIGNKNEHDKIKFEPGCIQPDPTDQLLEEMKSINISERRLKVKEKRTGILKPQGSLEKSREERERENYSSNILHIQNDGSETNENLITINTNNATKFTNNSSSHHSSSSNLNDATLGTSNKEVKLKRAKQNVALQSIYKKMEENKQVKFSAEIVDNEKLKKSPSKTGNNSSISSGLLLNQFPSHQAFPGGGTSQFGVLKAENKAQISSSDFFDSRGNKLLQDNRTMAANMMYSKNGLDPMNKGPFGMPAQPPPPQMFNQQSGIPGSVFNVPSNVSNPFQLPVSASTSFQKHQIPSVMPPNVPQTHQMPPGGQQFNNVAANSWNPAADQSQKAAAAAAQQGNWWQQQQQMAAASQPPQQQGGFNMNNYPMPPQQQPQQSFGGGMMAGGNMPPSYPSQGVSVDYNNPGAAGNMYSNPWSAGQGNAMPQNQMMAAYNNAPNPAMSMRQAMLNESNKSGNAMPSSSDNLSSYSTSQQQQQQQQQPANYSLFNSSRWAPNLSGQIRSQQNDHQSFPPQQPPPHSSLFNYANNAASPSLKQLLDQQLQLQQQQQQQKHNLKDLINNK